LLCRYSYDLGGGQYRMTRGGSVLDRNVPQPWAARTTLVLTLTLVAIALGNLQRMPFLLGEHGGAVFFLLYLLALGALSVPVLIAEVVVGSYGRASPHRAMEWAASAANVNPRWRFLGLAQGFLGLLVAAIAALFAVWCFDRAMVIYSGAMASGSPAEVASDFVSAMNDRAGQFTKALIGLAAAGALSAMGIRLGMGVLAWIVLPGVAITLVGVLEFVVLRIDLQPVTAFLFSYDGSQWGVEAAKQALISAGVTLGAGLGIAMALGAQAPQGLPWARSVIAVAILDTAFLFVTAIITSALLFEVNVAPSEGLAAVFVALPYAFVNVPMGEIYGTLFFSAMAAISWSAAVILMEPTVLLLEQAVGRLGAAILAATLAVLLTSMLLFSSDAALVQVSVMLGEWLLPLSLLATGLFVGWQLPRPILRGELYREPRWLFRLWWWVMRWVVPPVCVVWLISGVI